MGIVEFLKDNWPTITAFLGGGLADRLTRWLLNRGQRRAEIKETEASAAEKIVEAAERLIGPLQDTIDRMDARVRSLEKEKSTLSRQVNKLTAKEVSNDRRIRSLATDVKSLRLSNDELLAENHKLKQRVAALERIIRALWASSTEEVKDLMRKLPLEDCDHQLIEEILNGING